MMQSWSTSTDSTEMLLYQVADSVPAENLEIIQAASCGYPTSIQVESFMEQHHLGRSGSHSVCGILEANTGIVLVHTKVWEP